MHRMSMSRSIRGQVPIQCLREVILVSRSSGKRRAQNVLGYDVARCASRRGHRVSICECDVGRVWRKRYLSQSCNTSADLCEIQVPGNRPCFALTKSQTHDLHCLIFRGFVAAETLLPKPAEVTPGANCKTHVANSSAQTCLALRCDYEVGQQICSEIHAHDPIRRRQNTAGHSALCHACFVCIRVRESEQLLFACGLNQCFRAIAARLGTIH